MAALISIASWDSFFGTALASGTDVEDPGHPVPRLAGLPVTMVAATVGVLLARGGWCLDEPADTAAASARDDADDALVCVGTELLVDAYARMEPAR